MDWDDDITKLEIGEFEKNGLQVFRNYENSFNKRKSTEISAEIEQIDFDESELQNVLDDVVDDELRFLPILVCGYVDEILKNSLKRNLPDTVFGGKSNLLGGFGPLSSLSGRLSLMSSFGWIEETAAATFDILRRVRNEIAHRSHMYAGIDQKIESLVSNMEKLELLIAFDDSEIDQIEAMDSDQEIRARICIALGMLLSSSLVFPIARQRNVPADECMHGKCQPRNVNRINARAIRTARNIAGLVTPSPPVGSELEGTGED